mgnify:FL=1
MSYLYQALDKHVVQFLYKLCEHMFWLDMNIYFLTSTKFSGSCFSVNYTGVGFYKFISYIWVFHFTHCHKYPFPLCNVATSTAIVILWNSSYSGNWCESFPPFTVNLHSVVHFRPTYNFLSSDQYSPLQCFQQL